MIFFYIAQSRKYNFFSVSHTIISCTGVFCQNSGDRINRGTRIVELSLHAKKCANYHTKFSISEANKKNAYDQSPTARKMPDSQAIL